MARNKSKTIPAVITAVGYLRVSTEEQTNSGAGLQAQESVIRHEAERRSWILSDLYVDAGTSAKSLRGRPGLDQALEAVTTGRADVLAVAKLDRLSRSVLDFAALLDRSRKEGWALVALDLGVDPTTATGEAMANMVATFAQLERRLIGERTRDALAAKRAAGVRLGRPSGLGSAVLDRIADERATGRTLQSIADGLIADRVPTGQGGTWRPATVAYLLRASET